MTTKSCIACAEQIQNGAVLCRFCTTQQNDPRFIASPVGVSSIAVSNAPRYLAELTKKAICPECNKYELESEYYSKCEVCRGVATAEAKNAEVQAKLAEESEKATSAPKIPAFVPNYQAPASTTSIIAFVISLFIPVVGLILGYVAQNEIRSSNGRLGGDGFATAAIVIGWLWIVIGFFWLIAFSSIMSASRYY